jgi:hypothetical protein
MHPVLPAAVMEMPQERSEVTFQQSNRVFDC